MVYSVKGVNNVNTIPCFVYLFSFHRVNGGISNNDFVLELMSSLTSQTLDRPSQIDMSALGAAFLAGLATGN